MVILERIGFYFQTVIQIASDPVHIAILFGSVILGIIFGAMPGLTSTLGVALLTTLTYGMDTATAMLCLLSIYVGGTYGGSYASILINIPGTAASAATALDGYPLALKGEGGKAIGLTTTSSAIGTIISMLFLVSISPMISFFALQFTSFEFFLLAFFGILISGTLTSPDLVIKGWISGYSWDCFSAWLGRDLLDSSPALLSGIPELDSGVDGSRADRRLRHSPDHQGPRAKRWAENQKVQRILPEFRTIVGNLHQNPAVLPDRCRHRVDPGYRRGYCGLGVLRRRQEHVAPPGDLRHRRSDRRRIDRVRQQRLHRRCVDPAARTWAFREVPRRHAARGVDAAQRDARPHDRVRASRIHHRGHRHSSAGGDRDVGEWHGSGEAGGQGTAYSAVAVHAGDRRVVRDRLVRLGSPVGEPLPHGRGWHRRLFPDRDGVSHRAAGDRRHPRADGRREPAPRPDGIPGKLYAGFHPTGRPGPFSGYCVDSVKPV